MDPPPPVMSPRPPGYGHPSYGQPHGYELTTPRPVMGPGLGASELVLSQLKGILSQLKAILSQLKAILAVEGHFEPVEGHFEPVEGHFEPVEGHFEPVEGRRAHFEPI